MRASLSPYLPVFVSLGSFHGAEPGIGGGAQRCENPLCKMAVQDIYSFAIPESFSQCPASSGSPIAKAESGGSGGGGDGNGDDDGDSGGGGC